MLKEFEDAIAKILKEHLEGVPKGNIILGAKPGKLPSVNISNQSFEFERSGMAEEVEQGKVESEETFSGNGTKTSFELKERPMKESLRVEHPQGTYLTERENFDVDCAKGILTFHTAPKKGRDNVLVKYLSQKSVITLKSLKVKATYSIDVRDVDRTKTDIISEEVVKALLLAEADLAAEGIEIRPIQGDVEEEDGKITLVRLRYALEREMRLEQVVGLIERVEITNKGPLAG